MIVDIVFQPSDRNSDLIFMEVERDGHSIDIGQWIERPDGMRALRLSVADQQAIPAPTVSERCPQLVCRVHHNPFPCRERCGIWDHMNDATREAWTKQRDARLSRSRELSSPREPVTCQEEADFFDPADVPAGMLTV